VGNIATRLRAQGEQGGMWRKLELLASSRSMGGKMGSQTCLLADEALHAVE
jgi:hypothetical protein